MTKKFIAGAVAALAIFGFVTVKANAAFMYSGALKMGVTNSSVMSLQQTLNMTSCKVATSGVGSAGMESSYFGAKTKAAVQCFQAANGLTADGVVGPMTGAKLAAVTAVSTPVNTGLPAGCASTAGYSTTTGAPCSGTPATTVFPAGCTSSVGFSPTTGQPCSSTTVSTTGPLSINQVTANSGYSNTNVGVGDTNKQVADLRIVTGAGGSGNLTGVNLTFANAGTGDFQFTKYASSVSVWYNGVMVGSLPASSFTQYNSAFSAYVPLSGAMLNPNTTSDLYIAVSALPVIDSANTTSTSVNNWAISNVSLRYSDSTGSAFQYSISGSNLVGAGSTISNALSNTNFTFTTSASANNIKLTVTKDLNDSTDRTLQASASSNTTQVTVAMIDLNSQGSALTVQRLPITIGVGASVADVSNVVSTIRLFNSAGVQLDSESIPTGSTTACSSTTGSSLSTVTNAKCVTVNFQNFSSNGSSVNGFPVASGSSNVYTIKADINTLNGTTFPAGTYVTAELRPNDVTAIQAYDANNNLIQQNSTYLVGSTTGSKNYFYVNGINVAANGTATNMFAAASGQQTHGVFTMTVPFSVTSYGTTSYIPSTALLITSGTPSNPTVTAAGNIQFTVDNGSALQSGATATVTYTGNDTLIVDANGNYQIPVGQTKTFNLTVTYSPTALGQYRASLVNVNSNTTDSNSSYSTYTAGLNSNQFKTPYVSGQ
jgi:peptidoglycan hydrolase-like protein with peptidoglycan-binding domain